MENTNGELTLGVRREIIERELILWKNTRYQGEIRARVGKKAGDDEYAKAGLVQMEKSEKMIDALTEELGGLDGEG